MCVHVYAVHLLICYIYIYIYIVYTTCVCIQQCFVSELVRRPQQYSEMLGDKISLGELASP